jgi:hypothetical protein
MAMIVFAILAGAVFPLILLGLNWAVRPARVRMYTLAEQLIADPRTTGRQRDRFNHLLDTAFAFRVAFVWIQSAVLDVFRHEPAKDNLEDEWLFEDDRFKKMVLS